MLTFVDSSVTEIEQKQVGLELSEFEPQSLFENVQYTERWGETWAKWSIKKRGVSINQEGCFFAMSYRGNCNRGRFTTTQDGTGQARTRYLSIMVASSCSLFRLFFSAMPRKALPGRRRSVKWICVGIKFCFSCAWPNTKEFLSEPKLTQGANKTFTELIWFSSEIVYTVVHTRLILSWLTCHKVERN